MRHTKIICTLGPASNNEETMRQLLLAGMNVARLNFSHGTHEGHGATIDLFRKVRDELGVPAAVLLDTKGPEIRLGDFADTVTVTAGQSYTFTTLPCEGTAERCFITYAGLPHDVTPGGNILVDDGKLSFRVIECSDTEIHCKVTVGGALSSHKGVNVPDVKLELPFLSEKDKSDLLFGIEKDVDYVAASFTRRGEDVQEIREFLASHGGERIRIIAKIENTEGVEKFEEILKLADGIMVARGDMGVEVPFERLPGIQKMMIRSCIRSGKTVITATQMLDSMENNHRPTRAEISDVANAVYDGSSAVMLSGETAAGKYPAESVRVMARIAERAEQDAIAAGVFTRFRLDKLHYDQTNAVCAAACTLAEQVNATAIVADTSTGRAARRVAKFRPVQTILAATPDQKVYHQLALCWGAYPLMVPSVDSVDELFRHALAEARRTESVQTGDTVVLTAGIPLKTSGSTNMLKVQVVE